MLALELNVNDEKQTAECVEADDCVTCFIVTSGINQPEERIEEYFYRSFKSDAVVDSNVDASFLFVPDEGCPIEFIANITIATTS